MSEEKQEKELVISMPMDVLASMAKGSDMPEKAKIIFSLLSAGLSTSTIAKVLGNSESTIKDYIKKYDRDGCIVDAIAARRYFMAGSFETIAAQIAATITEKDLEKLSAIQRLSVAEKCIKIAMAINPTVPEKKSTADELIGKLKGETNGK